MGLPRLAYVPMKLHHNSSSDCPDETYRESETLPALHTCMLSTSCEASRRNGENKNVYRLYYRTLTANKVAIQNLHTPTKHYTLKCLNNHRIKKYKTKATHWNRVNWFCSSTFDTAFTYNTIL
jgi:hypothetical protein